MVGNQEGIGTLKLECPQMHSVGRILKEAPHQSVVYDPEPRLGRAVSGRMKLTNHSSRRSAGIATNRWEMSPPRFRTNFVT